MEVQSMAADLIIYLFALLCCCCRFCFPFVFIHFSDALALDAGLAHLHTCK